MQRTHTLSHVRHTHTEFFCAFKPITRVMHEVATRNFQLHMMDAAPFDPHGQAVRGTTLYTKDNHERRSCTNTLAMRVSPLRRHVHTGGASIPL